ncbi:MAG: hypothetical protein PUD93_12345 [Lachnospiraceae bacterium]|nr:hypothetical protein [Lachnospiraceae bacterium]
MKKGNYLFGITTVVLIVWILFCSTQTVMSQGKADAESLKQYYAAMEQEYLSDMEQILTDKGYQNSGITIRWVSDEAGNRVYTVMVHHQKIDKLSAQEQESLLEELSEAEFEDENSTFCYQVWTA